MGGDLRPRLSQDSGIGTVLANDSVPPATIVVDVDAWQSLVRVFLGLFRRRGVENRHKISRENLHAMRLSTGVKTDLHERIILGEVRLVQNVGFEVVVDQRLPSRGKTEDIEAINAGKVLQLLAREYSLNRK